MVKDYKVTFERIENYRSKSGNITLALHLPLSKNGVNYSVLTPKREIHNYWGSYSRAAVYSTFLKDISIKWKDYSTGNGAVTIEATIHPLVMWIWAGNCSDYNRYIYNAFSYNRKKKVSMKTASKATE